MSCIGNRKHQHPVLQGETGSDLTMSGCAITTPGPGTVSSASAPMLLSHDPCPITWSMTIGPSNSLLLISAAFWVSGKSLPQPN